MDRRDRDRYDSGTDYGRYEGYNRNDAHYHSARNLTDTFEQDYQRHRGHRAGDRYRMDHTYHEGDMGGAYEQYRREGRGFRDYGDNRRNEWDRSRDDAGSFGRDRGSNYYGEYSGNRDTYWSDRDRSQEYGNRRQRYGASDRYDNYNRNDNSWTGNESDDYFGAESDFGSSRYRDRSYGSDTGHEGSYGLRGGNRGDVDRNTGDNWRATHRLRNNF